MKKIINISNLEITAAVESESYSLLSVRKNCDLTKLNKLVI